MTRLCTGHAYWRKIVKMCSEDERFFEKLLQEDVEASDFSEFVPENAASESRKKEDAEDSTC